MAADLTLSGTVNGVSDKGPIGPFSLSLMLQSMRGSLAFDFEVRSGDAGRAIALPQEGTVQRMFLLCADQEFTFTLNGGGPVYRFRPGLPTGSPARPTGLFLILAEPVVASVEVTFVSQQVAGKILQVWEQ